MSGKSGELRSVFPHGSSSFLPTSVVRWRDAGLRVGSMGSAGPSRNQSPPHLCNSILQSLFFHSLSVSSAPGWLPTEWGPLSLGSTPTFPGSVQEPTTPTPLHKAGCTSWKAMPKALRGSPPGAPRRGAGLGFNRSPPSHLPPALSRPRLASPLRGSASSRFSDGPAGPAE